MDQAPLNLYYSPTRQDNFTTATEAGWASALSAGYQFVRTEDWVYPPHPNPDLGDGAELKLWYHAGRGDNFLTATPEGNASAQAAGYAFVRNEGWVLAPPVPGAEPPGAEPPLPPRRYLEQWWHAGREDNFLTGTPEGTAAARAAGYQFVRNEGSPLGGGPSAGALVVLWHAGRGDNMTVVSQTSIDAGGASGYHWASDYMMVDGASGSDPTAVRLQLWYHAGRQDHLTVATPEGQASAQEAGYTYVRDEGWVLADPTVIPVDRRFELRQFWHAGRQDNFLAPGPTAAAAAELAGYQSVRVEGYLLFPEQVQLK